jgi:ketosteroid isomerase-like protein
MSFKPVFERFMAATRTGDKATLAELVHPEFELIEPTGVPYEGTFRGLDGWRKLARAVIEAWDDFHVEPISFPGESVDTLVVNLRLSGRSRKTGRPFSMSVLELWTFRDGKVIGISPHYFDTHLLAKIDTP